MTAAAFVNAARGFVRREAQWKHQGRKPWAVDCIGLLVLSAHEAGYQGALKRPAKYARTPWDDELRTHLRAEFGEPVTDWQPGDVALVRWGKGEPSHVAILADYLYGGLSVIHAKKPKVIETILASDVLDCVIEVYRPKWSEG